jgi:hypothetical protein
LSLRFRHRRDDRANRCWRFSPLRAVIHHVLFAGWCRRVWRRRHLRAVRVNRSRYPDRDCPISIS